jgi:hypothetical protein
MRSCVFPPYWLQAFLVFKVTESRPKFCTRLEHLYIPAMGAHAVPDLQNNTFTPASSEFPLTRSTEKNRAAAPAWPRWRSAKLRLEPDPTAICPTHALPRSRAAAAMSAIGFDTLHDNLLHTLHTRRALGERLDGAAQFRSELLGDVMGVGSIANDLWTNEDDQLGPRG